MRGKFAEREVVVDEGLVVRYNIQWRGTIVLWLDP